VHREREVEQITAAGASRISLAPGGIASLKSRIARLIDHTLLKPEATEPEISQLCSEAMRYGFASVCVNGCWVPLCKKLIAGERVKICSVVGFPLGANSSAVKAAEAAQAVKDGADELDMVANIGWIKSGKMDMVEQDIREVVKAAKGTPLKVIIETALLTDEEKIRASLAAKNAGAAFVKTSTGFGKGGATAGDVALMRRVVGPKMGVKASGGVRDFGTALQMIESGATRIGASASVGIIS
jgi:deoxyribose-phosphate aldolase